MATRTAAERRAEAKQQHNAFVAACPTRQLLDTISDKWVTLTLTALAGGPLRYAVDRDPDVRVSDGGESRLRRIGVGIAARGIDPRPAWDDTPGSLIPQPLDRHARFDLLLRRLRRLRGKWRRRRRSPIASSR